MYVQQIDNFESLFPYSQRWDELADACVFRSWLWLATWWKYYGESQPERELAVLLVFEQDASSCCSCPSESDRVVAILPCYRERTYARGSVLRLLGDGEVCSDHLDLLVSDEHLQSAVTAIAEYITFQDTDWDLLDFTAVDESCVALHQLFDGFEAHDCHVARQRGPSCWSIELPATWDDFLACQSKSHRKQLRRSEKRILNSDRAVWHLVKTAEQFDKAWDLLVDLHQRRRQSLNEPGCFASQRWAAFHRDVARQLLEVGQLRLSWLELDGEPIAAEYHFASPTITFAYQGGLDPDRLDEEPGRLSMISALQHSIAEGVAAFDLLRGDEPYKAHWRATAQATYDVQVVPVRSGARLRYQVWNYLRRVGHLARQVTNLLS